MGLNVSENWGKLRTHVGNSGSPKALGALYIGLAGLAIGAAIGKVAKKTAPGSVVGAIVGVIAGLFLGKKPDGASAKKEEKKDATATTAATTPASQTANARGPGAPAPPAVSPVVQASASPLAANAAPSPVAKPSIGPAMGPATAVTKEVRGDLQKLFDELKLPLTQVTDTPTADEKKLGFTTSAYTTSNTPVFPGAEVEASQLPATSIRIGMPVEVMRGGCRRTFNLDPARISTWREDILAFVRSSLTAPLRELDAAKVKAVVEYFGDEVRLEKQVAGVAMHYPGATIELSDEHLSVFPNGGSASRPAATFPLLDANSASRVAMNLRREHPEYFMALYPGQTDVAVVFGKEFAPSGLTYPRPVGSQTQAATYLPNRTHVDLAPGLPCYRRFDKTLVFIGFADTHTPAEGFDMAEIANRARKAVALELKPLDTRAVALKFQAALGAPDRVSVAGDAPGQSQYMVLHYGSHQIGVTSDRVNILGPGSMDAPLFTETYGGDDARLWSLIPRLGEQIGKRAASVVAPAVESPRAQA